MSDDLTVRRFWTLIGLCVGTLALVALVGLPADHELGQVDRSAPSATGASVVPATAAPPVTTSTSTTTEPVVVPVTAAPATPAVACGGLVPIIDRFWPADQIDKVCDVIRCETGGTYSPTIENPRSTASGILQFLDGTWREARRYIAGASQYARASHAPIEMQIAVGAEWWHRTSWQQWECA